jgi:phenylalanyl-tRNA synthetase alpha chain
MNTLISQIEQDFKSELSKIQDLKDAESLKVKYLGKKGLISDLMPRLKDAAPEERKSLGALINQLKTIVEEDVRVLFQTFLEIEQQKALEQERIDVTLPGRKKTLGKAHPIHTVLEQMIDTFRQLGFTVAYGPDVDSDYYNFEGLNYPSDHPARDMQDTFYVDPKNLLRSHTSNTQLRIMEHSKPPIRVVIPGTVYRNENISARSHVFFHQVEGLYIDKNVSYGDLIATLKEFWNRLFKKQIKTRFRPSFFPFVEPGLEMDIECSVCSGSGCRICKHTGWLEVLGGGMVHPEVLRNGGLDPEEYSGFAFGMGIERMAMLFYGVTDIRAFAENDIRFLKKF